jgi:hypothetical protein
LAIKPPLPYNRWTKLSRSLGIQLQNWLRGVPFRPPSHLKVADVKKVWLAATSLSEETRLRIVKISQDGDAFEP